MNVTEILALPRDDPRREHYDWHSRTNPITNCNQPRCMKWTRENPQPGE